LRCSVCSLLLEITLLQSSDRSGTYSSIIQVLTPALAALAAALADNLTAALTPHSLLQQYKQQQQQQQQQQWENSEQQQQQMLLPEAAVGESGAVARGAAAAAAAAGGSDGAAAAAVPLPGGEEEARTAFKIVRHLIELMRDIKERCRWGLGFDCVRCFRIFRSSALHPTASLQDDGLTVLGELYLSATVLLLLLLFLFAG
jgi:hypothetical protein